MEAARWYCIRSLYKAEEEAYQHLVAQGFEVLLPLLIDRARDGSRRTRPLFTRYLFARFDVDADPWRYIVSTRGVERIISVTPDEPLPVPVGVVEAIAAVNPVDLYGPDPMTPVKRGARVKVLGGAFEGHEAICRWSSRRRVEVLMRLMGGEKVVRLDRSAVSEITQAA